MGSGLSTSISLARPNPKYVNGSKNKKDRLLEPVLTLYPLASCKPSCSRYFLSLSRDIDLVKSPKLYPLREHVFSLFLLNKRHNIFVYNHLLL